jgi:hypothetical protein
MVSLGYDAEWWVGKVGRDAENRLRGMGAELRAGLRRNGAPDDVIRERVRAKLGRYTSHARAVTVDVTDGRVTLRGPILSTEVQPLVRAVEAVRGVHHVDNQLEVHETADVPALQGGIRPAGEPPEWSQQNWTPALRALVGAGASILAISGMQRRGASGVPMTLAGAGLLARAIVPGNGVRRPRSGGNPG